MKEFAMRVEEPPKRVLAPKVNRVDVAQEFARQHPNQWCAVAEFSVRQTAAQNAYYYRRASKGQGFEFKSATIKVGGKEVFRIYARYTPPEQAE